MEGPVTRSQRKPENVEHDFKPMEHCVLVSCFCFVSLKIRGDHQAKEGEM